MFVIVSDDDDDNWLHSRVPREKSVHLPRAEIDPALTQG